MVRWNSVQFMIQNDKLVLACSMMIMIYDFIDGHKSNVRAYVQNMISSFSGFILDMFCTSMIDIANEFNVPSYIFFSSNAAFLVLCLHFENLRNEQNLDTFDYINSNDQLSILGSKNPCPIKVLPKHLLDSRLVMSTLFLDGIRRFKETSGIIINTFFEVESFSLQAILDSKMVPKIYPVGPVISFNENGNGRINPSETESIIKWLDEQQDSSVVFLCFGSMGSFEAEQIIEIATALEHFGHRFLWSLRRSPPKGKFDMPSSYNNYEEVLPQGFLERTKEIGKVIGWGKMDYVVDFEGENNQVDIVSAQEIESGLLRVMVKSEENEVRKKVKEMKEKSKVAMEDGGSSYNSLGLLIKDVITNNNS